MTSKITYDSRAADKRAYRRMMETPAYVAPTPVRDTLQAFGALGLSAAAASLFAFGLVFFVA